MKVRPFIFGKDYPLICEWWRAHSWEYLPKSHIEAAIGFVCEKDGEPLAAVWLYLTGTAFSLVEFLVTNPRARGRDKVAAIEAIINAARACSIESGAPAPITFVKQKSLVQVFERCGFQVTGQAMTEMSGGTL